MMSRDYFNKIPAKSISVFRNSVSSMLIFFVNVLFVISLHGFISQGGLADVAETFEQSVHFVDIMAFISMSLNAIILFIVSHKNSIC